MEDGGDSDYVDPIIHPFQELRKAKYRRKKNAMVQQAQMELCTSYLKTHPHYCEQWSRQAKQNGGNSRYTKCVCLEWMSRHRVDNDDEREAVARYMLNYYKKRKVDQQQILMDWIKDTSQNKSRCIYFLPIADRLKTTMNPIDEEYSAKVTNLGTYTVCRSAIGFILNVSKYAWRTCAKAVATNTIPQHGSLNLRGGRGKEFDEFIRADLIKYIEMLMEKAETRSTRMIRIETGALLRDDQEKGIMLLPSYMSKRQLYIQFCFDRGHIVDDTQKGFKTRPVDKGAILDTRIIPSWPCFYYFWKNEYSYLKITTSHDDVAKVAAEETKVAASAAAKSEKAAASAASTAEKAVASAVAKATKLEEREAQRKIAKATKRAAGEATRQAMKAARGEAAREARQAANAKAKEASSTSTSSSNKKKRRVS